LIDELHLFINPTAIGSGMSIFKELESKQNLKLVKSTVFDCGIVVLKYELKRDS
jgi:dihydrofolate reductase